MTAEPFGRAPEDPPRTRLLSADAHKGDRGRALVVAGSVGMSGAARLAAAGVAAGGVGLVLAVAPEPVRPEIAAFDPALMTRGVRATLAGTFAACAVREVLRLVEDFGADACLVGPGLGEHPETTAFARRCVAEIPRPLVVDADALNALAAATDGPVARASAAPRIFTPHPGEAARLLGVPVAAVQGDREAAVRALQARLGGVVVLKGAGTLVCDGAALRRNDTGNAALAVGGTGDVLAGLVAAYLARGALPLDAACDAVRLHGAAADRLVRENGPGPVRHAALCAWLGRLSG
ncbi:MAG TPA: NAD(P)H-hydrate dehydratase [Planctomycetota bacterium]|nr:NAD(P)H-hydrate dehydratase [Planctomycetota bacterium]